MKTMFKPFALLLAALLSIGSLTACNGESEKKPATEEIPTPEKIIELIKDGDNVRVVTEMRLPEMLTETILTMTMEGNKAYMLTEASSMGQKMTEEEYREKDGDVTYTYYKDEGVWKKEVLEDEDEEDDDQNFMNALFDASYYDAYDAETRRYNMKEGTVVEADGMILSEGYIEICEDGSYVIYAKIEMSEGAFRTEGSLKITMDQIGTTSVTLPKV